MVNDLRVCKRYARARIGRLLSANCGMRYRDLLGVKWSQVQILSARPEL
jgi:integrase